MAYEIAVLTTMSIAILFALSLNIITGFCGQVSLGHAAFYGMGAYTAALLTKAGVPLALALLPAAAVAGAVGFVVGMASLRVRHDFLAITTMGVTFLFVGFVRKQEALGGEVGISGIPSVASYRRGRARPVPPSSTPISETSPFPRRTDHRPRDLQKKLRRAIRMRPRSRTKSLLRMYQPCCAIRFSALRRGADRRAGPTPRPGCSIGTMPVLLEFRSRETVGGAVAWVGTAPAHR